MTNEKYSIFDAFLALKEDDSQTTSTIRRTVKRKGLPIKEAVSVNIQDEEEVNDAIDFRKHDEKIEPDLEVIDVDANTLQQLKTKDSYIGKILLQCKSCKATTFIKPEDLEESEEGTENYNVDMECPYCHNTGIGYDLVGQIGKKEAEAEPQFDNNIEDEEETEKEEVKVEDEQPEEEEEKEPEYDETDAVDDTELLNLPKLGDEFDVDDVREDDTEIKKESLEESTESETEEVESTEPITEAGDDTNPEDADPVEPEEEVNEDVDLTEWQGTVASLLNNFVLEGDEDSEITVNIFRANGEKIGTYNITEVPFRLRIENVGSFNTESDIVNIEVYENEDEDVTTVKDVFLLFSPETEDLVTFNVYNETTDESEELKSKDELIDKYGNYALSGNVFLKTINIYLQEDVTGIESEEEPEEKTKEEELAEAIIKANPSLKLYRINNTNSDENFILESLRTNDDLDIVYEKFVERTNNAKLIEEFKSFTGFKSKKEEVLESYGIDLDLYNWALTKKREEEYNLKECLYTSVKKRAELTEVLDKLTKKNIPYQIKRATNEEFRYDVFIPKNLKEMLNEDNLSPVVAAPRRETRTNIAVQPKNISPEDAKIVQKIMSISNNVVDAVKEIYGIDVDIRLVAADIMRDLALVGGKIDINELTNSPVDQVTAEMYRQFMGFNNLLTAPDTNMDKVRAQALRDGIKSLYGPEFTKEAIKQKIKSNAFLEAGKKGYIPFIPAEQLLGYTPSRNYRLEDFNENEFQECVNDYLYEKNQDTDLVEAFNVTEVLKEEGKITVKGVVDGLEESYDITYTLTPILNEEADSMEGYKVTNNLNKEELILDL